MSEPTARRPLPGPPPAVPTPVVVRTDEGERDRGDAASRFAGLADRPVAEHVAVYEAEHERLQRELSTIDQL